MAAVRCVWTKDLGRAFRIAEQLDYGIVGVNDGLPAVAHAPFGGVKFSGIGREGGPWGMDEYLDVTRGKAQNHMAIRALILSGVGRRLVRADRLHEVPLGVGLRHPYPGVDGARP